VVGTALSVVAGGTLLLPATLTAAAVGLIGNLLYVYWYSVCRRDRSRDPQGSQASRVHALGGTGRPELGLFGGPALWVFYRGNWCPICVAQVREIAAQYRELARRGVEVFLVSPQTEGEQRGARGQGRRADAS
jgi:hypothetical protein